MQQCGVGSMFTIYRYLQFIRLTLFVRHARKSFCILLTATRSCGRFGPDTDVTIVLKSNVTIYLEEGRNKRLEFFIEIFLFFSEQKYLRVLRILSRIAVISELLCNFQILFHQIDFFLRSICKKNVKNEEIKINIEVR